MVKCDLNQQTGILTLEPSGKLTTEDFAEATRLVDPYIAQNKVLNGILIQASEFPGWKDFAAFVSHLRFVKDHHKLVNKIAIVSDDKFLSRAPELAKHFVHAEIRHFDMAQRAAALSWLQQSGAEAHP